MKRAARCSFEKKRLQYFTVGIEQMNELGDSESLDTKDSTSWEWDKKSRGWRYWMGRWLLKKFLSKVYTDS